MNRIAALVLGLAGLWFLLLASPRSAGEAAVKYAFAAILLWSAYRRLRAASKKTAEYRMQADGEWTRLTVLPAAPPTLWFPAGLAIVLGAGVVGSGVAYLWVLGLLFAALAWLTLLKDHRGGKPAGPRSLRVGPQGIETEGALLRKDDIHRLRIRNQFAGGAEIVYDAARGLPTGVAMGLAGRRALAEVAYRVEVEAAGKAHVLAAGLDEVTAAGLVTEIGKALERR
ncbi:MAG: hypothetical protein IBJ04_04785 [Hydrogenophaga sp.]|uniref:hypothetical protein n=1 Tax=Hydrogenophaga sp. TaxID=1904254 RepID=UPI00257ED69A|nr:hypothetical protein [Hydrogenophaga sp.]MBL0943622.1 hypothetical protein [Hydrogenophaga sp.]